MEQATPPPANPMPKTDAEWIIHSINIHGLFFERWCQQVIREQAGWDLKAINYPVEFPRATNALRGKESALDIRAELTVAPEVKLNLLIECKKHNPEFVNWIFFPKSYARSSTELVSICQIENRPTQNTPLWNWTPEILLGWMSLPFIVVNEFREARQQYAGAGDRLKTKTANAAVSEAAYQIALARQAMILEETRFSDALSRRSGPQHRISWNRQAILPAIVTSARLWLCDFDPHDVDSRTGEIPLEQATLTESPVLVYEYPIPPHLQLNPASLAATIQGEYLLSYSHGCTFL